MSLAPSPDPTLVRLLSRLEQLSVLAGSGGKYQPDLDGQLLRVHVMGPTARRRVVEDVPPSTAAELARPDGLAPRQHPTGQGMALEQLGGPVLDQSRPGAGADGFLGQALEGNTGDACPDQNVGREQPRRSRFHNAHIMHD